MKSAQEDSAILQKKYGLQFYHFYFLLPFTRMNELTERKKIVLNHDYICRNNHDDIIYY